MVRNDFNFIKVNGRNAKYYQMQRASSVTALDELKKKDEEAMADYCKGEVPA